MLEKCCLRLHWERSGEERNAQAKDFADLSLRLVQTTLSSTFCVLQLSRKMGEVAATHFITVIAQLSMGYVHLK
jgi:hypothetical protein